MNQEPEKNLTRRRRDRGVVVRILIYNLSNYHNYLRFLRTKIKISDNNSAIFASLRLCEKFIFIFFARVFLIHISVCIMFIALLTSCSSLPTDPAPWDASPAALRQFFSDSEYIAQRGRGKTRAAAETNAAAEISRFISSQISANRGYRITTDNAAETIETHDEAFVRSQINLFGIRYADDAYYRKDLKEWRTVAWIERNEAWTVYAPRFKQQADSFISLFDAAENERDQFRRALRFLAADDYSKSDDFQNASLFGQILHPARMNAEFESVRAKIALIPQRLESSKRNASIFIDCPGDFESLVSNAFSSRFAALGFPVANNRNSSSAVCRITIS